MKHTINVRVSPYIHRRGYVFVGAHEVMIGIQFAKHLRRYFARQGTRGRRGAKRIASFNLASSKQKLENESRRRSSALGNGA